MQRLELTLDDSTQDIQFIVVQSSEWLILRFDWEERMTWGELRLIDPDGRLRFTYMDVHGNRAAVIHREQKFIS
ncbi:hypothetical protein SAMN02799630_04689 [Paenibacillus sp. UNCCL117]|uniref:hypothetical protein n=1 Tax=unclassified Paenibacillus TaxID=185978 RepID=UPI00088B1215|nr:MULTISPECIES: hypothetical protein [unclassified Paenibacillus]SDE06332.1 hypothetical protein SAMN04488602_1186 [Paenibacillus sp. cl123]SFW59452.1 hypothetical protein SAMN02799630_04689 [Paenibacillus sp. UNCCL117]